MGPLRCWAVSMVLEVASGQAPRVGAAGLLCGGWSCLRVGPTVDKGGWTASSPWP